VEGAELLGRGWQHTAAGVYVYGPQPGWVRTVELDGPPAGLEAALTRWLGDNTSPGPGCRPSRSRR